MTVSIISLNDTLALRQKYLRPKLEEKQCVIVDDEKDSACHFGAKQHDKIIGVCSVYQNSFPNTLSTTAWQLRMMATDESVRHHGFGKKLINGIEQYIRERRGENLWCNARASAISFYEVVGFKIEGGVFDIPDIGPHVLMHKKLNKIK